MQKHLKKEEIPKEKMSQIQRVDNGRNIPIIKVHAPQNIPYNSIKDNTCKGRIRKMSSSSLFKEAHKTNGETYLKSSYDVETVLKSKAERGGSKMGTKMITKCKSDSKL